MKEAHVRAIATALTALLALGCLAMSVGHSGVDVPGLSSLGPGGDRAVVPAAIAFGVAALLLAVIAWGIWRTRSWSWAAGVVVHALIFLGAAVPFRGVASAVAMVITAVTVALLVSPPGRSLLLRGY
jgi:hypothetical protein